MALPPARSKLVPQRFKVTNSRHTGELSEHTARHSRLRAHVCDGDGNVARLHEAAAAGSEGGCPYCLIDSRGGLGIQVEHANAVLGRFGGDDGG